MVSFTRGILSVSSRPLSVIHWWLLHFIQSFFFNLAKTTGGEFFKFNANPPLSSKIEEPILSSKNNVETIPEQVIIFQ